ncbi:MAG TPA: hypothetical protein VH370_07250 [Humisphaera sp.]|jgi:hypothetical protein|nr:hypothetical protein [Humisphaera sp.]
MMLFRRVLPTVAFLAILQIAAPAKSGVAPLNPSIHGELESRQAIFSLTVDHPPDLNLTDAAGHQIDDFQAGTGSAMHNSQVPTGQIAGVVRGEEIRFDGMLPIRAGSPAVDPQGGGWAAVMGSAPSSASGDVVAFSSPLAPLGSSESHFAYEALTTHDAQFVSEAQAQMVPLPVALPIAAIVLLMVILVRWGTAQHMRVAVRAVRVLRT